MGSLELLSYFWSLNTIPVVKIQNFDLGHLTYPPNKDDISIKFIVIFINDFAFFIFAV